MSRAIDTWAEGTNLLHERRKDDLANVEPEVRLELERALRVEEQVAGKTRKVVAEALVDRVIAHSLEPVADGAEETVEVRLVLVVVEAAARLADLTTLVVAPVLENEAGYEEYVAGIRVSRARRAVSSLALSTEWRSPSFSTWKPPSG